MTWTARPENWRRIMKELSFTKRWANEKTAWGLWRNSRSQKAELMRKLERDYEGTLVHKKGGIVRKLEVWSLWKTFFHRKLKEWKIEWLWRNVIHKKVSQWKNWGFGVFEKKNVHRKLRQWKSQGLWRKSHSQEHIYTRKLEEEHEGKVIDSRKKKKK